MDAANLHLPGLTGAAGVSWLALVANTALGPTQVEQLRTEVSVDSSGSASPDSLRLIVQSYARDALGADCRPKAYSRPLSSAQRSIRAEELAAGFVVDLVQLDAATTDLVVIAWIEDGEADLEYDALAARPGKDALYGSSLLGDDRLGRVRLRPSVV
jgi:hypothetical protein